MIVWGSGGANSDITLMGNIFPYPLTVGQCAVRYVISLTMACMLFSAIASALSAALKAPFSTIVIMSVLLIVPMFINVPGEAPIWIFCLNNLLPTNMMAYWGAMFDYQYEIFGLVIPPYVFLPVFAAAVSCLCSALAYRSFRKHQIS